MAIDQAKFGGQDLSRIRLNAQGTPQASDISLNASARGFGLDARARVLPGDRTRIELQKFTANRGAQTIVLAGPATLTIMDGGVDVANLALSLGTDGSRSSVGPGRTSISEWRLAAYHCRVRGFLYRILDWRARSTERFGCSDRLPRRPEPIRFASPVWLTGRSVKPACFPSTLPLPEP